MTEAPGPDSRDASERRSSPCEGAAEPGEETLEPAEERAEPGEASNEPAAAAADPGEASNEPGERATAGEAATADAEADATPTPTAPGERIVSLDAIRGFALLGILVINIQLFSMPLSASDHPPSFGDFTGANYAAWFVSHVFFELKFVTLFSLLFGAGIVLFTASKERKGQPALSLYYRRSLLLLLIGLGHAYLLWYGDILVTYAVCGLVAVRARHWRPRRLAVVGVGLLVVASLTSLSLWLATSQIPQDQLAAWAASETAVQAEIEAYRGGWLEQLSHRAPTAFTVQTSSLVFYAFWRTTGVMLLGMALFERGVLTGERAGRFYRRLLVGGGALGLGAVLAGVWYRHAHDWAFAESVFLAAQFNYWGSLPLAGAYVAGLALWCRRRPTGPLTRALAAVGRTAFSNYLLQTVLATTIFYGHGLRLFASVSRVEQLGIVVAIWAIQVALSVLWLRSFRFGPVEWLWRSLTYGERQPMRVQG